MSSVRQLIRAASTTSAVGLIAHTLYKDEQSTIHCAASTEAQLAEITSNVAQLSNKLDKVLQIQSSQKQALQLQSSAPTLARQNSIDKIVTPIVKLEAANSRVTRVVLTGGPCGGKSSCLSTVEQHLKDLGYSVYIVPEASTMLKTSGYGFPGEPGTSRAIQLAWEERKMRLQIMLEDLFVQLGLFTNWTFRSMPVDVEDKRNQINKYRSSAQINKYQTRRLKRLIMWRCCLVPVVFTGLDECQSLYQTAPTVVTLTTFSSLVS